MRIVFRTPGRSRFQLTIGENRRQLLIVRIMLGILAFQGAVVGLWAVFAPHSWYVSFPGFGMQWISADGPFNHHLSSDVGSFFLAVAAVTIAALVAGGNNLVRVAGMAWLIFGLPHLIYHAAHKPAEMSAGSYTISIISAILLPALGLACILLAPTHVPGLRQRPVTFRIPGRQGPAARR